MIHAVGYSGNWEKLLENSKTKVAIRRFQLFMSYAISRKCPFDGGNNQAKFKIWILPL
jgi:hypothetical protein